MTSKTQGGTEYTLTREGGQLTIRVASMTGTVAGWGIGDQRNVLRFRLAQGGEKGLVIRPEDRAQVNDMIPEAGSNVSLSERDVDAAHLSDLRRRMDDCSGNPVAHIKAREIWASALAAYQSKYGKEE